MPCPAPHPLATRFFAFVVTASLWLAACSPEPSNELEAVKRSGELVMITRNSPTTYYEGPDGPTGFEYELARAFAQHLGVSLEIRVVPRFADILPMVVNREAHFAAAGITVTPARQERVRFAPSYQTIRQQVVHNSRTAAPKDAKGLVGRHIEVAAGTTYVERLEELKKQIPGLEWTIVNEMETEELLLHVAEGLTDFTVADSNIVAVSRQFDPDLRIAFDLSEPEALAWAFPLGEDDSLFQAANDFFREMQSTGRLSQLLDQYYGAVTRFNPINVAVYIQKIRDDLPQLKPLFEEAAHRYLLDWRLLAAIAYQESYWNAAAVSPTGVRGMMMLTETTAQHMRVDNRLDPRQSIQGGANYLRSLMDRIPERIQEPDRTWMALAAYNVGLNHLEDARVITESQGGDPDKWNDVKDRLPLLAKAAWYTRARHGYARGYEPVQFVTRIRTYYDVLKKDDIEARTRNTTEVLRLRAPAL